MYIHIYIHMWPCAMYAGLRIIYIYVNMQTYIYIYAYCIHVYGSFSFVGLNANKKECALWSHSTWVHSGHGIYIDDSYQKAQGGSGTLNWRESHANRRGAYADLYLTPSSSSLPGGMHTLWTSSCSRATLPEAREYLHLDRWLLAIYIGEATGWRN